MNTERKYTTDIRVDTRQAFLTIARALDYVGIDDVHHAHRVAYTAYECGQLLNWPPLKLEKTFYSGLLHDCGVTSSKEHLRLLEGMIPSNVDEHCERGFNALNKNVLLCAFANIVRYHHTPWAELKNLDLDTETKDITALIHLADRVDFLRARYAHETHPEAVTLYEGLIAENILSKKDTLFQPEFAEAMARLVNIDGFWFAMDYDRIEAIGLEFNAYKPFNSTLEIHQITELASFLANIVDAKSPFTYHHSQKVAKLSKMLAIDAGLSVDNSDMVYVAGLLHDVGKLKTPDEILYKNGPLEGVELSIMKRHSVDTLITLDHFFPDSKIGQWAANHHEKLDGSGYPYQLQGEQLDIESRIIAIADIFQALSQTRPYRGQLSFEEITTIMDPMVEDGKLDKDIYQLILIKQDEYYQLSSEA
jgi:putative nucleotidyltransferase with HDIG domain